MTLDQYLAALALKGVLSSDFPEVGIQALMEGYDSTDLAVLAGSSSRWETPRELEELLRRGLRHLDKRIPSRAEAGRILRDYYAALVAKGTVTPRDGAAEIVGLSHDLTDVLPSKTYAGDGLGVAKILGLYYSHDDVPDGDNLSHQEIDDEIKKACRELLDQAPTLPGST